MSYAELMKTFADKCDELHDARAREDARVSDASMKDGPGVHVFDNAPSLLFDYSKSEHRQNRRAGEAIEHDTIKRLEEWNKHDSVSPLMFDGKPLVTFSIMLHDGDSKHAVRPVDSSDAFEFEHEQDQADESYTVGEVGFKHSQQLGMVKQGRVDYITVVKIKQAIVKVTASLYKIDLDSGRKLVTDASKAKCAASIGRCLNEFDLFNALNRMPYANDRSTEILAIANFALHIPNHETWLPTLMTEHFENGNEPEEWRKPKIQPYRMMMVDAYMKMLPQP